MEKQRFQKQEAYRFKRFARKPYSIFNSMHKVVTIGVLTVSALTFANSEDASAQKTDSVRINQIAERELDEVIISSSSTNQPINQIAKLITIVSKDEIQRLKPQSIEEILNYVASVDIQTRGSHGVQSDISIRGGSFDQNAILLNGINISNPQTGHYSFDIPINLSDIERIEIIHGPSSIIYGSSAFSGGINIITKKGIDKSLNTKLEAGGHNLWNGEISGSYKIKNLENYISMGYKSSDGYIKNTDYKIFNILYQSRLNIKKDKIDLQFGYNKKAYGANSFYSAKYPNQFDKTNSIIASVKGEFGTKLKLIPSIYWNRHNDEFKLIRTNDNANNHRTDVLGSNLNLEYNSKIGVTYLGLELRNENILSSVLGEPMDKPIGKYTKTDNRTNLSYMLQHNLKYKKFTLSLGVLGFVNTSIENHFKLYPSLNLNYKITDNIDLYTSFSQSSRLPTFTDLYYTSPTHIGNSKLKQEESQSVEIGLRQKHRYLVSYISAFYMNGRNMIDWVKINPEDKWESKNISQLDKTGIEMGGKVFIDELFPCIRYSTIFEANYTRMHQDIVKNQYISNYILNYLRDKLTIRLTLPIYKDKLTTTLSYRYQKRMGTYLKYIENQPTQSSTYPAYSLLDININYKYKNLNLYLNINNIFNTHHFDLGNIPQPGIWAIIGASVSI
ncbi:MAG: TonB-dependent receptor [Bacteroidales bacterium]|nr:TonB-dependent receptor [Bacteroidales bacterium]